MSDNQNNTGTNVTKLILGLAKIAALIFALLVVLKFAGEIIFQS